MGLDKEVKMVHQEVKKFLVEKGIKQSRLSILIEESFPDLKFSKNKLIYLHSKKFFQNWKLIIFISKVPTRHKIK